jgi:hypothetical protein
MLLQHRRAVRLPGAKAERLCAAVEYQAHLATAETPMRFDQGCGDRVSHARRRIDRVTARSSNRSRGRFVAAGLQFLGWCRP